MQYCGNYLKGIYNVMMISSVMLFILILPSILMLLFCNVYSDTLNGVNIALVSDEVLPDSCLLPEDHTRVLHRCKPQSRYSCRYIQLVRDKSYTIVSYSCSNILSWIIFRQINIWFWPFIIVGLSQCWTTVCCLKLKLLLRNTKWNTWYNRKRLPHKQPKFL